MLHFFRYNSLPSVLVPNMMFLASTVLQILGGSRNSESGSRAPYMTPFDLMLHFSLELTAVRLRAKYEVSSFNRSRDIRRAVPKFQNRVMWAPHDPFWPYFESFFRQNSPPSVSLLNMMFLASTVREILGSQIFQNCITWPPHDPFWPNFALLSLELSAVRLLEKNWNF